MDSSRRLFFVVASFIACLCLSPLSFAETENAQLGLVLMHGKGGAPSKHVSGLASSLEGRGVLVANLEMPWSGGRNYDVDVAAAEKEVETALKKLQDKGAKKLFVAGHSQGGVFALYYGGKHAVQGIIAIAPGGDVSNATFTSKLGGDVDQARKLVAEGKGNEKTRFSDFEGSKGLIPILTTPAIYLTWFDPAGAMNQMRSTKSLKPSNPVLYIAPTDDYPGLRKVKEDMFNALPKNLHTRLAEPSASHLAAPAASADIILTWMHEVAATK